MDQLFKKSFGMVAVSCIISCGTAQQKSKLEFNSNVFEKQEVTVNGAVLKIRAYENISYVADPVDTVYQKINVYIPEAYFEGEDINGYTAETAPIFFPNQVGGYMPAKPGTAINDGKGPGGGGPGGNRQTTIALALAQGYVVASPGARGRTTQNEQGSYTGKAPAAIVDLKAAVRYLKYNDRSMPGDASRIISNGTSAGGALSSLIGATGNNKDYEPYLLEIGAADATDDIFAVSAYCPITNLDHADMAYEWQFNGVNNYAKRGGGGPAGGGMPQQATVASLTDDQIRVSGQLKAMFPEYVNGLELKGKDGKLLQLDESGNGNFRDLVKSYVIASAQKAMDAGTDLSGLSWIKTGNGKITDLDFDAYVRYMERMKTPPAFDALDLSSAENQLFGDGATDKKHFTAFSQQNTLANGVLTDMQIVDRMNPMDYIGKAGTTISQHWRIRHGTKDKDTGLAISVMLATLLENKGYDVSLELPWDKPHSGDYDLNELFEWIDTLCKK